MHLPARDPAAQPRLREPGGSPQWHSAPRYLAPDTPAARPAQGQPATNRVAAMQPADGAHEADQPPGLPYAAHRGSRRQRQPSAANTTSSSNFQPRDGDQELRETKHPVLVDISLAQYLVNSRL